MAFVNNRMCSDAKSTHAHSQSLLPRVHISNLANSLTCICKSKINTQVPFMATPRHPQSGGKFELSDNVHPQWRWNEVTLCLVSTQGHFHGLFSAMSFAFWCFLLAFLLLKMAPSRQCRCAVFPSMARLWGALWRKQHTLDPLHSGWSCGAVGCKLQIMRVDCVHLLPLGGFVLLGIFLALISVTCPTDWNFKAIVELPKRDQPPGTAPNIAPTANILLHPPQFAQCWEETQLPSDCSTALAPKSS